MHMKKDLLENITGELGYQYLKSLVEDMQEVLSGALDKYREEAMLISDSAEILFTRLEKMSLKGKKIRAGLMMLGYEVAGGKNKGGVKELSYFMEIFHTGLLIHDDIMDNDTKRRGEDSFHVQMKKLGEEFGIIEPDNFGNSMAIMAGDLAYYLSWRMLLESDFPVKRIREVSKIYARFATRMVYGQVMDISRIPLTDTKTEKILSMMRYKTAEYTGVLPLEVGAVMGGIDEVELEKLRNYGLALGWAFQVRDDLLGLFGEEEILGKPVGSDLREGKNTLLMLKLFEEGSKREQKSQKELMGKENLTDEEVEEMKQILLDSGVYNKVKDLGWQYVREAVAWADKLNTDNKNKDVLKSLAVYIMERVK
jgi:geranylgeranyl diphosphate synthase, type I